jgi:hypothetical protein
MPVPFPFIPEVKAESSCPAAGRAAGMSIWNVGLQIPPACSPHCSPSISALMRLQVDQYNMAAVPIDSPERSREAQKRISVIKFYDVNRKPAVTPEQFLHEFATNQPPGGVSRVYPYLTDIVGHQPWTVDMAHSLNTVLLTMSSSNLCSLMMTVDSGGESNFGFPGLLTGSWYFKVAWSYFNAHVEQLFAPSLNVCYMGGTTWWCIKRADVMKYETFLIHYIKNHFDMDREGKWTVEQSRLLLALLYAKKTFIDPRLLKAAGIEVFQLNQEAGEVVMLDGDIVHLGMCSKDKSINEAINFLPVGWLVHGLPLLDDWVEWLKGFIRVDTGGLYTDSTFERVIFNDRVRELVGKHCPRGLTTTFLRIVKKSIQQEMTRRQSLIEGERSRQSKKKRKRSQLASESALLGSIDYSELQDKHLTAAVSHIDNIVTRLNEGIIRKWYSQYCPGDM